MRASSMYSMQKQRAKRENEKFTATTGVDDPRTPFGKEDSYMGDGAGSAR